MRAVKIKVISNDAWQPIKIIEKECTKVDPVINYEVSDGEYLIRGSKKDHAKYYFVRSNTWYLHSTKEVDNGHYLCDAATFRLFPNLSEKEWELMNKIPYKRLTKYWRRAIYGYNFYMELRELRRNMRIKRIKILGK